MGWRRSSGIVLVSALVFTGAPGLAAAASALDVRQVAFAEISQLAAAKPDKPTGGGKPPKDLLLSATTVDENLAPGTTVGTLSAIDPNPRSTFTYALVAGTGSADNAAFTVAGALLKTAASFDFETKSSYSIRLRVTNAPANRWREEVFTITVVNANEAPTDVGLSPSSVAENEPVNTIVGTLSTTDPDAGDTATFSLVAGAGDTDNASFNILGGSLRTSAGLDFEVKDEYSIRVRGTDGGGLFFDKQLTVAVTDANDAPTDITLSPSSVDEDLPAGTTVGVLSGADQDALDTLSFALVTGAGDTDNDSFEIDGTDLKTTAELSFNDGATRDIRVRVFDGNGGTFEKQLTVTVTNINEAPTDLALSPSSVAENQPVNTVVGSLSATDPDPGDSETYALVAGTGDTDNASFNISGGSLRTSATFDFETRSSYSIRVQITDGGGLTFEKQLTVTVTDANDAPINITLSSSSVTEGVLSGTTVGTLAGVDQDVLDTLSFSLVSGSGDADNASFQIDGTTLKTAAVLDFADGATRTIRVRVSDGNGGSFEKQFTITVTNVNDAPTNILLSPQSVPENQAIDTAVGTLSATDPDPDDTTTFTLVAGTGDTDNASFNISGDSLRTSAVFSYEAQNSYSIRVRVTDGDGLFFEEQLTITVTDVNEAPTNITLSSTSVAENLGANTVVGSLTATDPDAGGSHTFTLVAGTGDTDNASFNISGDSLRTSATFNFEVKDSYSVRVRATDNGGQIFAKHFTVTVTNVNDAPTNITLAPSAVAEGLPSDTTVGTLSGSDEDALDLLSFTLVAGTGDTDNASFQIAGSALETAEELFVADGTTRSIRVSVSDGNGGTFEKSLTITVTDPQDSPTDLALSSSSVAENQAANNVVGILSATDPDPVDSHTFTLVAGTGSDDNASFNISGTSLRTSAVFNFEVKNSYSIRVRATDSGGLFFEKQLTITVTNVNDAPTDIAVSASTVAENSGAGTTVGTLSSVDQDSGATHTYTLVFGTGSTNNAAFQIVGNQLQRSATALNFETTPTASIRVRTTDNGGLFFEEVLTITVTNVNDAPTDIDLSASTVAENSAQGTAVGTFSSVDQDAGATHTYTLAAGTGSTNNAAFQIVGGQLQRSATALNFETTPTASIRVRTTDNGGLVFEEVLTITVTNVNEAPTNIDLSASTVVENSSVGTAVGTLSSDDQDSGATHTYTLVAGTGSTNNAAFQIVGNSLQRSATALNFETTPTASIRVRTTDNGGLIFEEVLTVTVTNVNEAPTDLSLSPSSVSTGAPSGTAVGTLTGSDPDAGSVFTFALVSGTGSTDNASFQIDGTTLETAAVLNAPGPRSIRVRVTDAGGLIFEKQLVVTVDDVNDAPTDIRLNSTSVSEDWIVNTAFATLQATDPDPGDTFTFSLVAGTGSTDNASFNISGAQLRPSFALDFETKSSYSIRVRVTDGGGLFFEEPFTITVTDVNDAPVADDESFSGVQRAIGNTSFVGNDPTDGAPDPGGPQKTITGDILAGDTDQDGTGSLAVVAGTFGTFDGGSVVLEADGDFTFHPAVSRSCFDHSDSFGYTLTDQNTVKPPGTPATDVGLVTIELQDCVWYVDSNGSGGNGTSGAPLDDLASIRLKSISDPDFDNDHIFLYDGTYNHLQLEFGQKLFGQRHGLSVSDGGAGTVVLEPAVPAGPPSTLVNMLMLNSGVNIQGVDLGATTINPSLFGNSVSGVEVGTVTPGQINNPVGAAIELDLAFADMAFTSVSSAGGQFGIELIDVEGSFTAPAGAISDASIIDVHLERGGIDFTYGGSITDDAGELVRVRDEIGGTKDFNGPISDGNDGDGDGISLFNNIDATIRFDGGLTLSTNTAFSAFIAHNTGTLAVTDPAGAASNTVTSSVSGGNPIFWIQDTTIHPDDLTFERISVSGGPPGIHLEDTGNQGGLVVTGTGPADSGGVIQGSVVSGIELVNVGGGVNLTRMRVAGNNGNGIVATNTPLNVQSSAFTDNRGDHIQMRAEGAQNLTVNGSTFNTTAAADPNVIGGGIAVYPEDSVNMDVTITNNDIQQAFASAIAIDTSESLFDLQPGVVDATITGNTIGNASVVDSGSEAGRGIYLRSHIAADIDAVISSNVIRQYATVAGIEIVQNGGNGTMDVTMTGNTIGSPGTNSPNGILVTAGSSGSDAGLTCVDIGHASNAGLKNTVINSGGGASTDIRLRQLADTTIRLPGYAGANNNDTAVVNYLASRNILTSASAFNTVSSGGGGFVGAAACTLP